MNKRKYKKFVKKFYKKSYYNVRLRKIINFINMKYTGNYIPYIVDSKKGNLKHPYSINVLIKCYPVSCEFNKNKRRYDISTLFKSSVLENDMINDKSQEMLSILESINQKGNN